jgi:DNA-3-methyladenine glycosylase
MSRKLKAIRNSSPKSNPVGPITREYFSRKPETVARELLGAILFRRLSSGILLSGRIAETEAYGGRRDPASHAFRGMTERNRVMFGIPGVSYVYFTYGFHYCLNVVTGREGDASAVLIRALEPIEGIEDIRRNRRFPRDERNLTNGPGKLCQAFAINKTQNGLDLTNKRSELWLEFGSASVVNVSCSPRIGIKVGLERHWRFYDSSSRYVSRSKPVRC